MARDHSREEVNYHESKFKAWAASGTCACRNGKLRNNERVQHNHSGVDGDNKLRSSDDICFSKDFKAFSRYNRAER